MAMGSHLRAIKQGSKMTRFAFFNGRKIIMLTVGSQIPTGENF